MKINICKFFNKAPQNFMVTALFAKVNAPILKEKCKSATVTFGFYQIIQNNEKVK